MTQFNENIPQQPNQYIAAPLHAEQEIKHSDYVRQRQLIPNNFLVLKSQEKNNVGPAEGFGKPGYERYLFNYQDHYLYLDFNSKLLERLGLISDQNCKDTLYVSSELLDKSWEKGGISIDNLGEIIFVKSGTILEREVQTELTNHEFDSKISDLQAINVKLSSDKEELLKKISDLKIAQTSKLEKLTAEKDKISQENIRLERELANLKDNAETDRKQIEQLRIELKEKDNQTLIQQAKINNLSSKVLNHPREYSFVFGATMIRNEKNLVAFSPPINIMINGDTRNASFITFHGKIIQERELSVMKRFGNRYSGDVIKISLQPNSNSYFDWAGISGWNEGLGVDDGKRYSVIGVYGDFNITIESSTCGNTIF